MEIFPGVSLGDNIDFNIYPSSLIGTTFHFCSIIGVLDYKTAQKFIDVDSLHSNVYPTLPETTPNDPSQYEYLKVLLPSGQDTIIGMPWVNEDSILVHSEKTARFTIENVGSEDLSKISKLLAANGYHAIDWSLS